MQGEKSEDVTVADSDGAVQSSAVQEVPGPVHKEDFTYHWDESADKDFEEAKDEDCLEDLIAMVKRRKPRTLN